MGIQVERFPRSYWTIDGLIFNRFEADDIDGNLLRVVETSGGWEGRPANKSQRRARNLQHGSHPGASHLDERTITWQGWSISYSEELIGQEMLRLRSLCSDPWATYELLRWEPGLGPMICNVQPDDTFEIQRVYRNHQHQLLWSAQFVASDPRMYEAEWRTFSAGISGGLVGGVSSDGAGVSADNGGVSAGVWQPDKTITVHNLGSAEMGLIFELEGPWSNATIHEVETARQMFVQDEFGVGNVLYINTDVDKQYGIPGRMALRDLVTSRRNRVTIRGGWPSVPPGSTRTYLWRTDSYDPNANMRIRYRSSWR